MEMKFLPEKDPRTAQFLTDFLSQPPPAPVQSTAGTAVAAPAADPSMSLHPALKDLFGKLFTDPYEAIASDQLIGVKKQTDI